MPDSLQRSRTNGKSDAIILSQPSVFHVNGPSSECHEPSCPPSWEIHDTERDSTWWAPHTCSYTSGLENHEQLYKTSVTTPLNILLKATDLKIVNQNY